MRTRVLLAGMLVLCLTVMAWGLGGCAKDEAPAPTPEPTGAVEPTESPEPPQASTVRVYFTRGEKIGVAAREVAHSDDSAELARAAVDALVKGPTDEEKEFGLGTVIPAGTTLNGVEIRDGVATVDLGREFESGGGSLSMLLRVAQVVCTLTQFDDVRSVAFELDGRPAKAIGGEGIIVDPPVDRADFEGQLPAILVESPTPGQEVSSPIDVFGSSNVFEAVHQLNVTDPDGLIIAEKTVSATSGTGTRGTWSVQVPYGQVKFDGLGAVIVFVNSAEDGSQTDVVEIPVRMKR